MPRIRTIKPQFFTSEAVAEWHPITRLVFMGLLVHAEDNGVGSANERLLASAIFPMDDRDDAIEWTRRALDECSRGGQIVLYEAAGRRLFAVMNWDEHQRVDRPSATRWPRPTEAQIAESFAEANTQPEPVTSDDQLTLALVEPSSSPRRGLDEGSSLEGKGREGKGKNPPSFVGGVQGGALAVQPPLVTAVPAAPAPSAPAKTGTRLSESWAPSEATQRWTRSEGVGLDITREWAKFQDYWLSKPGAAGRKLDWDRTWKNWVRKACEDSNRRGGLTPSGLTPKDQKIANIVAMGQRMEAERRASFVPERRELEWG